MEELGAREREEEHRPVGHVRDQVLDQIEQRIIGPVRVLEHDHERIAIGQFLDESARRELQVDRVVSRVIETEAHQQREVSRRVRCLAIEGQRGHETRELAPRLGGRVVLEDARRARDDLGDGAVRRLLRVREATTPQHPCPAAFELPGRFTAEAGLPDAGWTDHGDQMRLVPRDDPFPGIADDLQLSPPTDERGSREPAGRLLHHSRTSQPGAHGLALALGSDRVDLVEGEDALHEPMGLLADDDTSGGRGRLQPGGGVHDVAGRKRLPGRRVERDDGFARAHRCPDPEAELGTDPVQLLDPLERVERGANGAFGVIVVGQGRSEHRHHRVADELLHDAAEPLDAVAELLVVSPVQIPDVFGVGAIRALRRADHVNEQHRDELPLIVGTATAQLRTARGAEPRVRRRLRSATGTAHAAS